MRTLKVLCLFLIPISIVLITTLATTHIGTSIKSQRTEVSNFNRTQFESQFPVVDYSSPGPSDPGERAKRHARNSHYDKKGLVAKPNHSGKGEGTAIINDWEVGLSALPVSQSTAVIIGEVINAQAFLSNDKSGVYSEFSIRVEEIFKDSAQVISNGGVIIAEREGGRVRFAPDDVELYTIDGQGMPQVGRRYLLFLKDTEGGQAYHIVTGYELRASQVFPLDLTNRSRSMFDVYKHAEVDTFLRIVKDAITTSAQAKDIN